MAAESARHPEPALVPVVAGVVLVQDGKVLLVQERKPHVFGKWNLPAGKVDVGETLEQAAVREAKEETGFDIELNEHLITVHESIDRPVLHAFAAHITGGKLHFPPDEILDARWFTPAEIDAMSADLRSPAYVLGALERAGLRP
jgi:8-oxo-dGTP diphosphatase